MIMSLCIYYRREVQIMLQENNIVIDPNKSAEFLSFLKTTGKSKQFWEDNAKVASTQVDENELNQLFEDDK